MIHMEALRHLEENTDRTIVFKIYRALNLFKQKKLIGAKINYIKLLFFVEFHIDIVYRNTWLGH